jgi:hypothetical protein
MYEHQHTKTTVNDHLKDGCESNGRWNYNMDRIAFSNVEILDKASSELQLRLKEMMYIHKYKNNNINVQKSSALFTLTLNSKK